MKLVRSYDDIVLKLKYMQENDAKVYFSSDNRYKVIVSKPFEAGIVFITIAHNPNNCVVVGDNICRDILKNLNFGNAFPVDIEGVPGVKRYVQKL